MTSAGRPVSEINRSSVWVALGMRTPPPSRALLTPRGARAGGRGGGCRGAGGAEAGGGWGRALAGGGGGKAKADDREAPAGQAVSSQISERGERLPQVSEASVAAAPLSRKVSKCPAT